MGNKRVPKVHRFRILYYLAGLGWLDFKILGFSGFGLCTGLLDFLGFGLFGRFVS